MPPRYSYWTIIVDNQPTAFRASQQEDLLPTFNRLKEKQPTAVMKWFQRGRLWASREEAQAAFDAERDQGGRPAWSKPSGDRARGDRPPRREHEGGAPTRRDDRGGKSWSPKPPGDRPWKRDDRGGKSWSPKPPGDRPWKRDPSAGSGSPRVEDRDRKPPTAGEGPPTRTPARDKKWRPGGEHRDPRQKYKDAKKAKWTRFKQRVRQHGDRRKKKKPE